MRLLFADDDEDIREMTAELLGMRGYEVTTVSSGKEALEVLEAGDFDIAVLDHNMPPGSGLAVATERRRAGDQLPMVLWTGFMETVDADVAAQLDVHVLNKGDVARLSELVGQLTPRT